MSLLPLPPPLIDPVATLQTDLNSVMLNAGSIIKKISAADAVTLLNDVLTVETVGAWLINSTDATVASPASDAMTYAASLGTIVEKPTTTVRYLQGLVNPNLFLIAAQFLGDATLWQSIAVASKIPVDPQPIGVFNIVVPSN